MNEFNIAVKEVLENFIQNLQKGILDNDSLVGFFYIKNHTLNGSMLSIENRELIVAISLTLDEKYEKNDIKILVTLYLLKTMIDLNNEDIYCRKFFKDYINFQDLQNILDNKELIKMIYPQDKLSEFLSYLNIILAEEPFFEKDLEQKEKIIYIFHFITTMFYEREEKAFKQMYKYLYRIFLEAIEKNDEEVVFYLYFPLQFSWNGVSTSQEDFGKFNNEVEKKLEKYIKERIIPKYNIKPVNKDIKNKKVKKVAFIHDRLINYSIFNVFERLLKVLKEKKNENFEFLILDLNFPQLGGSDKEVQERVKKLGFEFIECHERFFNNKNILFTPVQKCIAIRKMIIEMDIDILVGMHSQPDYNFLFTTRTAPLQIYWSHGNFKYMIDTIDKRITHSSYECYDSFSLPLNIEKYDPKISIEEVLEVRRTFPKDSLILGSIGRLVKIDNFEFLETVKKIILKNPKTVYLACGSGDKNSIIEKLLKLDILEYFYFPGHINSHIYGHVIDIWLESFPYGNGESRAEYYNKESNVFIMIYLNEDKNERRKRVSEFLEVNETSFKKACDFYGITIDEYKYLAFDISELTQAFNSTTEYIDKTNFLIKSFNDKDLIEKFKLLKKVYNYAWNMISKDSFEALLK